MNRARGTIASLPLLVILCGAAPSVDHISPPSWWSADAAQDVTILIEGTNLKEAKISASREGFRIVRVDQPGEGHAIFVDVSLSPNISPGPVSLEIDVGGERIAKTWEILPRPRRRPDPIGPDDVIYLVMPDRFANGDPANDTADDAENMLDRRNPHAYHGGDFAGLKARLPYLADLGVTALWLTPVYRPAPKWFRTTVNGQPRKYADFHGYSPVDFYDTNPHFGSRDEYRALVDGAHKLGLKVIQDQVVGYTGPQHRWVAKPPTSDWFHGPIDHPPQCNFRFDAMANPHALESLRRGLTDGWFFGILPDMNTRDPRVKRQAIQQSLWWAEVFEADGFRLDTYPMVDRAFWRDWTAARKSLDPKRLAIGEAWVNDAPDLSFFQGGRAGWDGIDTGIEAVFDFPLNFAVVDVASNGASAAKLARALSRDFLFPRPDRLVTFLDNHDTPRIASAPKVTPARHRLAAAFLLTTRGIPQLTWGDEIGLGGHGDDRRDFPGGWKDDPRDAFTPAGRTPDEQATFEAYRTLLRLRKGHPALRAGRTTELIANDAVFAFLRESEGETLLVVLNFGGTPVDVKLPREAFTASKTFTTLYGEGRVTRTSGDVSAEMPGERAGVFRVE